MKGTTDDRYFLGTILLNKKENEGMRFLKMLLVLCALLAFATQAHALSIRPTYDTPWTVSQTSNDSIKAAIEAIIAGVDGDAALLYKMEVGVGEEGPLAGSYSTAFFNTPTDPADATITYTGGDIVGAPAFLAVKDGKQSPSWYLYQLPADWNGMETIELTGFWPAKGAISYVGLYGTSTPVPEPATMLLLGSGLVGLAEFGRKKFLKRA
jgi:hypothetical protein